MDFALPQIGEGVYEAELVRWLVQPGQGVKRGQNLLEVMTDKATMEVPAPFVGTIAQLLAEPGTMLKVGEVILRYEGSAFASESATVATVDETRSSKTVLTTEPVASSTSSVSSVLVPSRTNGPGLPIKASPSVRHLARKLGVDLGRIHGSGPDGRVLLEDLTQQLRAVAHGSIDGTAPSTRDHQNRQDRPDYGRPGMRIKMQGLRRRIAEHMTHSKRTIPHYSYVEECDVTELVRLRGQLKDAYARQGVKLTYLAFFVKAVVSALKEIPLVNSRLDEESNEIVLHHHYHIGVAVATPTGLIVPVIHDADRKDLGTIAREIERLSSEARTGKSRREDLRDGCFTLTSVGNIGGLISTPVINHPEVGILGIGKVVKRPVYDEAGQIRPADLVYLSFSFDHRVVDGAVGAAFGNAVLRSLLNPAVMLVPETRVS